VKTERLHGPLPAWVKALDEATFGEAWGEPDTHELIWTLGEAAFARWSVAADEGELLRVAVSPDKRGQGLGRALLQACEKELDALGVRDLHLEVRVSNGAARRLYVASGWRESGLRKGYYRDGEDAALYAKRLG